MPYFDSGVQDGSREARWQQPDFHFNGAQLDARRFW